MRRSLRPRLELLEDRLVPATWGIPWPDAHQLSLSLVPDGTVGGLTPSNLFQTLNQIAPTPVWETQILAAFQSWAVNANIDIGLVADGGQPFGTAGAIQGDSRFGDIRIGAASAPQKDAQDLADAQPFDWAAGTWAGDVLLSSVHPFAIGNTPGQYDLYTVFLHEAGHALGLDETSDPAAAMFGTYHYLNQLSPSDIANIQALYGVRAPDTVNNGTLATAQTLGSLAQGISINADLSSLADVDYYQVTTPSSMSASSFTVQVKTSGISLLMPSLTVYDASGNVISSAAAVDPLHNDVTLTINAAPGTTYYLQVGSATQTVFGIGAYQLNVQAGTTITPGAATAVGVNLTSAPHNSTVSALGLNPKNDGGDARFNYVVRDNLGTAGASNFYTVQSPSAAKGGGQILVVTAWVTDASGLQPMIQVYDANQNPVNAQVLVNGQGSFTIEIPTTNANATYYIQVSAEDLGAPTGNYLLAAKFGNFPTDQFQTVATGTENASSAALAGAMTVSQDALYHFQLDATATSAGAQPCMAVTMTILDSNGQTVFSLSNDTSDDATTGNVYLATGSYTVVFTEQALDGSTLGSVSFTLSDEVLSGALGARPTGPTPPSPKPTPVPVPPGLLALKLVAVAPAPIRH